MFSLVTLLLVPAVAPPARPTIAFDRDIAPLLRVNCLGCHSAERSRGDLALTSRTTLLAGGANGPAVQPGKSRESLLFQHVRDGKMPPKKPLAPGEVELIRRWIDAGAPWEGELHAQVQNTPSRAGPDWWSLRAVHRPALPVVRARHLVRTPIDAFLLNQLEAKGLSFSAEADRRTLLMRLAFDLTGLPPSMAEIAAFERDPRPDAYERQVERLLGSPQHGERMARHWLDVVRFAESHGYEMNTLRPSAWPYRDWVIRAFNQDLPLRDFLQEQLAGDALPGKDRLAQAATGFLVAGAHDMVGNATEEGKRQQRSDDLFDMVSTTGSTFLGLTVGCARCHDHKFDPISQRDFYAFQALLAGVEHTERTIAETDQESRLASGKRPPVQARQNVDEFPPVTARLLRFTIQATSDGSEPCIDELEVYGPGGSGNLALANQGVKTSASSVYPNSPIHRLEHLNDGQVGNSRSWISAERGKGWVVLELPRPQQIHRVVWGRDRNQVFRDRLATNYRIEVSLDGKAWQKVASSEDRSGPPSASSRIYAGGFRTPDVIRLLQRGDVMQPRDVVEPAGVAAIRPALVVAPGASESDRRLALANWLAHPDNPLVSRVLVNRLWHWHFGQGIVRTPGDFGFNGDRPSHPELLDWLASEFQASRGSTKHMHRLIVLSTAYRQASARNARAFAVDSGNRLLWRFVPRRLEAEAIRDRMLLATGELDLSMGGPGYHLWEYSNYVVVFNPKARLGPAEFRRMIYQFKPRLQQDSTFGVFDCPDGTTTVSRRNHSTTALQALNLLNDAFVLDRAEKLASRVSTVRQAFALALNRAPFSREEQAAGELVAKHGMIALCRALFNANEFVFVD